MKLPQPGFEAIRSPLSRLSGEETPSLLLPAGEADSRAGFSAEHAAPPGAGPGS